MDLRQSHFELGNQTRQSGLHETSSAVKYEDFAKNPSIQDKEQIQKKMLSGNFTIGDDKNRSMKDAQSSYNPAVAIFNEG